MVIVDQFRISDDGKDMYIDVHVNHADYFENVYLDSITLVTADKVSETNPGCPSEDYIYKQVFEGDLKEVSLVLHASDFMRSWEEDSRKILFHQGDLSKNLFFLYVKVKGLPSEGTPCCLDKEITVAVTFDYTLFYQQVMQLTKELNNDCEVLKEFIDLILLWNGFKAAVETEHWVSAIDFYNRLFGSHGVAAYRTKPCGCHG